MRRAGRGRTGVDLDARATRFLAGKAFQQRAIEPTDLDFIDEKPERAGEVPEFVAWLAGERTE